MLTITVVVLVLSVLHSLLGLISVSIGIASSIAAGLQSSHSVSPIWSGAFFILTGILGFFCSKKRTEYMIMCFTGFSIISLVTAIASIQLLRLGLKKQPTDDDISQQEESDGFIIIALVSASCESLICVISSFVSCRMAKDAKKELQKRKEDTSDAQVAEEENSRNFEYNSNESEFYDIASEGNLYMDALHQHDNHNCVACSDNAIESSNDCLEAWDSSKYGENMSSNTSVDITTAETPHEQYIDIIPDGNDHLRGSIKHKDTNVQNDRCYVYTISQNVNECFDDSSVVNGEVEKQTTEENNFTASETENGGNASNEVNNFTASETENVGNASNEVNNFTASETKNGEAVHEDEKPTSEENNFIASETENEEAMLGGEKPRLKRILSLIANER